MSTKKSHPFIRSLGVLCYLTAILYLASHFYPSRILDIIYSTFGAVLLICAFAFISTVNRFIIVILLSAGSFCLYMEETPPTTAVLGFGENINLLSLFLLIPLIGTFMSTAGYLSTLKEKVQEKERKRKQHPYFFSFLLTSTVSVILNYGAMAIVKHTSEESFSNFKSKKMTLNIMRGFGINMLWSPYFVNVGLILVLFDLSWFDISGYGMILACIYLFISWILFRSISFPNDPPIVQNDKRDIPLRRRSLVPFFTFSTVLIALSFLLDYILEVNMLTVVSLLALLLPFIWAMLTRVTKLYMEKVSEQVQYSFIRLKNELAIFISAGFFGNALSQTKVGLHISSLLFEISLGSDYLLSLFIVLLTVVFAQIGMHPVIIVTGIGSSLSSVNFGISSEYMALCLLIAWTTATQMSPFSGQVLMASRLMNQKPATIVKANVKFSLTLAGTLTTAIYFFHIAGWL